MRKEEKIRFIERIDKQENGCWVWKGNVSRGGYGLFQLDTKTKL
jgi:hypothetical protein